MTGESSGMVMLTNLCHEFAPSTVAAFVIVLGNSLQAGDEDDDVVAQDHARCS